MKSTLAVALTLTGFTSLAQMQGSLSTSEDLAVNTALTNNKAGVTSLNNEVKAVITKAERQSLDGLKNFYKIDEGIYRSEQPDENDFIALEKMGLLEVLNVRRLWSDDKKARHTDLKLHHISMKAGDIKEREVIKALKVIDDRKGPILVHCWHGSDRTGMLMAMYRLVFQNWTKDDAIHEMTKGNFGFHTAYSNIIDFVRDADIEKIKEKVLGKKDAGKIQEAVVSAAGAAVSALPLSAR